MSRGFGEATVAANLPEWLVFVGGLVTQLGDMWFVVLGIVALYLAHRGGYPVTEDPWRDCLFLLAVALGAYALTLLLKVAFGLPRPPGAATAVAPAFLPDAADPVYASLVTGDGYGFPSGHATKSAAVYGAAALTLTVWERDSRLLAARGVAAAVAVSRVVIGVHYLVDVAVGLAVGAAFLAALVRTTDARPGPALGVAAALSLLAFAVTLSPKAALGGVVATVALGALTVTERSARAARAVGARRPPRSTES